MPLSAGTYLGPYEITAPLGSGGMGEVYRAHDSRLGRTVAIKIVNQQFSERFEREARAVAALNHPNICQIYDVGENYLVMELVDGENLCGPLPLDVALEYARQIGEALEVAHEKGIIHRDLKPANIKVTTKGVVKVLDFGLAIMTQPPACAQDDASNSPTFSMSSTRPGMLLGTAAYMSPEQARGKSVDKRSDIWSFGAVLYEMLAGERAFQGETITDVLAAVVTKEPDLARVPAKARRLLESCLQKDPKRRLHDIADAKLLLDDAPQVVNEAPTRARLPWLVAGVFALLTIALVFAYFGRRPEQPRLLRFSIAPPEKAAFRPTSLPAISPDGRRLAFVAVLDGKDLLWIRDLDSVAVRPLPGTEGADDPFWSPDSRFLAFFAQGKLKKIDVDGGGPALILCDALENFGGTWGKRDVIVFALFSGGLLQIPAAGGMPAPVTVLDRSAENSHRFPSFLPDGRHFFFTAASSADLGKSVVYLGDLESLNDSKTRRRVLLANSNVVYAAPGYLLFVRDRTLMAQPFDAEKAQIGGDPIPIAAQVDYNSALSLGEFATSQNGVLIFTSGGSVGNRQFTWFDRRGKALGAVGTPGMSEWPAISPDGGALAFDRFDPQTGFWDIWLHDLAHGADTRFTFDSKNNNVPVWSPDGSHIAFASSRDGGSNIYQKATNGAAPEELLDGEPRFKLPLDWSDDGRHIIELVRDPKTKSDVWVLPLFGDRKPFPYLQGNFNEGDAKLSPNGRWLAYVSDETNRTEVYVQTFPMHTGKWQVSNSGGGLPVWSRDGKELFFVGSERTLMAVEVNSSTLNGSAEFKAGVPQPLFQKRVGSGVAQSFDVGKDGRFLMPLEIEQTAAAPITVVVNWTSLLKQK